MKDFCNTAHEYGFDVVCTPAEDLFNGVAPDKYTAFINSGIAGAVAAYCDYYHVQAQELQNSNLDGPAPSFLSYLTAIIAQIQAAAPPTLPIITVGLAANAGTESIDIISAILATVSLGQVPGYWLNVPASTNPVASEALAALNKMMASGVVTDSPRRQTHVGRGLSDSIARING
jgi:hypothetical protein